MQVARELCTMVCALGPCFIKVQSGISLLLGRLQLSHLLPCATIPSTVYEVLKPLRLDVLGACVRKGAAQSAWATCTLVMSWCTPPC